MKKRDWPHLILGLLVTTAIACRPITQEDPNVVTTSSAATTIATAIASQPSATPTLALPEPTATPTPTALPLPTAVPTRDPRLDWLRVGDETRGMQFAVPPNWVNFSPRLDVTTAANQLGITTLLLVDAERTGTSLLAGKEIGMGAFVLGVMSNDSLPLDSPRSSLNRLLATLPTAVVRQIQPITADSPSGTIAGATADLLGDPIGFLPVAEQTFQVRLLLFPISQNSETGVTTQALLLLGAPADAWPKYDTLFDQIASTLHIYHVQSNLAIGGGRANIVGELLSDVPVQAALAGGVQDVWAFSARDGRYATLTVSPEIASLDLRLTVLDASGQVVVTVDNGYAGDTEIAADVLLAGDGRYFVKVDDFFDKAGRYSLSLSLNDEPLHSGGGRILPGQTIQSILQAGQHLWRFEAMAGEIMSIVLMPANEQLDLILNLYGPDGHRLVALDEGFSGDAELISGFALPITGEYTILVTSFANMSGTYSLSLNEGGEQVQNFYEAGDLFYGDVRQESLQAREAHAWYFSGAGGDRISIKVMPLDAWLDMEVWLLDANVERLAVQDDSLMGEAETIEIVLPDDGQYVVLLRDFFGESGRYEITLVGIGHQPPTYAGMLTYGEGVAVVLQQTAVYWLFNGRTGDVINVTLTPVGNADFLFSLYDPTNSMVIQVDSASLGGVEQLAGFILTADGHWRIVVETFFAEGGAYSLLVDEN